VHGKPPPPAPTQENEVLNGPAEAAGENGGFFYINNA
jgi:hypothetical protein